MDLPVVQCSVKIEYFNSNGSIKSTNIKLCRMVLLRNNIGEIILKLSANKIEHSYNIENIIIHDKLLDRGLATLRFPSVGINILISNAPSIELLKFIKGLNYKLSENSKTLHSKLSPCSKFTSRHSGTLQEISPLSSNDVKKIIDKNISPLVTNNRCKKSLETNCSDSPTIKRPKQLKNSFKDNLNGLTKNELKTNTLNSFKSICQELSDEQKDILHIIERGKNIFFTGGAGTGKSFLLKRIIGSLPIHHTIVTASTGVAASYINGSTLHSVVGFADSSKTVDEYIKIFSNKKEWLKRWKTCKYLIIDEISMIDGNYFDIVEEFIRKIRNDDRPFGGLQLIICGDFLQLPPVQNRSSASSNKPQKMCFEALCWEKSIHRYYELTRVYRQSDREFIDILNELRIGNLSTKSLERLNSTYMNFKNHSISPTILCTHKQMANQINELNNAKLSEKEMIFNSNDSSTDPNYSSTKFDSYFSVQSQLKLKIGSQVMLCKNISIEKNLVNGSTGSIIGFDQNAHNYPIIKFKSGLVMTIKPEMFTFTNSINGAVYKRQQIPLYLAWAISIHKSQGMTIDCLEVDLSNIFEYGQAYVALSRAKSLDTIKIIDININNIRSHPKSLEFYKNLQFNINQQTKLNDNKL